MAGTDGSDTARRAIAHAAYMARAVRAELTVACVHSPDAHGRNGGVVMTAAIAQALLRDVEKVYRGSVPLRTLALPGQPAVVLAGLASRDRFDLVVVGNKGLTGGFRIPQRGIADGVVHRARGALLVVDTVRERDPGYRRILLAVDEGAPSAAAADVAGSVARAVGGDLTIATTAASEPVGQAVLAPFRARWPRAETRVLRGPPFGALPELAESGRYDLLVLGSRGSTGPRRFLGSAPEKILHRAGTSVLVVSTS